MSVPAPLMIRTALSHNSGIPASVDNLVSCAQADDNDSMSSALSARSPDSALALRSV